MGARAAKICMDTDLEGPESMSLLVAVLYHLSQYLRAHWVSQHLKMESRLLRTAGQIKHRWGIPANLA